MNASQHDQVREYVLTEGLQDFVALWEVHQGFAGRDPAQAPPLHEVQVQTLNMIKELVIEGLVVLGVPSRKEPSGFAMWDLSVEAAMAKIEDAYVKNFDDDRNWIYMVWMNLTAFGQQLGLELYHADDPATKPRQIASAPSDPDSEGAPRGMNACRTKVWRGYRAICPLGDTSPAMMLPMIATQASTLAPAVLPASARLWAKSGTNDDPPGAALRDG